MSPAILVIDLAWAVFLVVWIASAFGAKKSTGRGRGWQGSLLRIVVIIAALRFVGRGSSDGPAAAYTRVLAAHPAVAAAGAALTVLGIAWAIWARVHIGRNWGMPMSLKETPELITSGPYALSRHPIYTGILVAMLGSAVASGLWWFVILVPSAIYFIYSARAEERLMLDQFPRQYPAYVGRTKMLVPFIF